MKTTHWRNIVYILFVVNLMVLYGCQNSVVSMPRAEPTSVTGTQPNSVTGTEPTPKGCEQIVYSHLKLERDGSEANIVSVCPDGTEKHKLTADKSDNIMPSWSPDGSEVAFLSNRRSGTLQLHLMNPDGAQLRQITLGVEEISGLIWLPEGDRIALVTGTRDKVWQVVKLATKEISPMPGWTFESSFQPIAFSHDGTRLMYLSSTPEVQALPGNQIRIQNRDGSGDYPVTDSVGFHLNPVWSPDDSQIAYVSDMINPGKQFAIYIIDIKSRTVQQVTHRVFLEPPVFSWSPDGKSFAVYAENTFWILDVMSGELNKLFSLENQERITRISWQP